MMKTIEQANRVNFSLYNREFFFSVVSIFVVIATLKIFSSIVIRRNAAPFFFAKMLFFSSILLLSCTPKKQLSELGNKEISAVITEMSDIMLRDITNPPLAARFFSYACLSGYEVISRNNQSLGSMRGKLNAYPHIKEKVTLKPFFAKLAALLAMMETSKKMQPSGSTMAVFESNFIDSLERAGWDKDVLKNASNYAKDISKQILAYAKADGYNRISNFSRYAPIKEEGKWYPTAPAFMAAVEPNFNTVRSFTLDSASQFKPVPPIPFNSKTGTAFYQLTSAVYSEGKESTKEHRIKASFWDCNPFAVQGGDGHLQYGFKKISPGAHWLGITGIACLKTNKSFEECMQIYTAVSIGLMDAFICCWDEKYRSNRIRPETAIHKYIDPDWVPLLQTPPFPEYLSGHSVISAASAVILTYYIGDNYSYTDSVETAFDIPARSFKSFTQAASEAGISRFYGGIHFMDAINNGQKQGALVGEWVLKKLKLKKL